ncbi:hypothetical protein QCD79_34435, partial [Pseudomonas quasicaspiana]|nr:hypothetical protein [Pseudomonas quasicaspiana]
MVDKCWLNAAHKSDSTITQAGNFTRLGYGAIAFMCCVQPAFIDQESIDRSRFQMLSERWV